MVVVEVRQGTLGVDGRGEDEEEDDEEEEEEGRQATNIKSCHPYWQVGKNSKTTDRIEKQEEAPEGRDQKAAKKCSRGQQGDTA